MPREAHAQCDLSAPALLQQLVGEGEHERLDMGPGDLLFSRATVDSYRIVFVCFDYATNHGSIGVREAQQLVNAIRLAASSGEHLVFLFETSGIRVTDSTAGIASLRRVLREAVEARIGGVRMLALILKSTFGGASLLASICERRVINSESLFSMSGPKLIEPAGNVEIVRGVLNGASRAETSDGFVEVDRKAREYQRELHEWLRQPAPAAPTLASLATRTTQLAARLEEELPNAASCEDLSELSDDALHVLRKIFPAGYELRRAGNVVLADSAGSGSRVVALFNRPGATAVDSLILARELAQPLLESKPHERTHERCVILLDAESHSSSLVDERVVLSEYLAHLALVIGKLAQEGVVVDLVVTGHGGGGIQGALGCAVSSVAMTRNARLFVLPRAAMHAIGKAEDSDAGSIAGAMSVGAVDHQFP